MSSNVNLDDAVECVKVILESNKCGSCDRSSGKRLRYPCGHTSCGECVAQAGNCILCLTPPGDTLTPLLDTPATKRADNAAKLIEIFQQTYNVDVYRRHRVSEQLKVERELFPECIQAPMKYFNKKRSYSRKSKENRKQLSFPGEQVSPVKASKMEQSFDYVKNWLDTNDKNKPKQKRKPFSDLNVNQQRIRTRTDIIMEKVKENSKIITKNKKKSSFKTALSLVDKQCNLDQYVKTTNKKRESKENTISVIDQNKLDTLNNKSKNESGIAMDDDAILIEDSQSEIIDKDQLALLAVIEANERDPYISQTLKSEDLQEGSNTSLPIVTRKHGKVLFYKRSSLANPSNLSNDCNCKNTETNEISSPSKDVSITIENSSFIATIKMSKVQRKPTLDKHSVTVQTDISAINDSGCHLEETDDGVCAVKKLHSQDLFTAESNTLYNNNITMRDVTNMHHETTQLVIADSDNEEAGNSSRLIEVTAEVHHSSDHLDPGILSELGVREAEQRMKRSGRGHTPISTDSSDKENFDPNRSKRAKLNKKNVKKRKLL